MKKLGIFLISLVLIGAVAGSLVFASCAGAEGPEGSAGAQGPAGPAGADGADGAEGPVGGGSRVPVSSAPHGRRPH